MRVIDFNEIELKYTLPIYTVIWTLTFIYTNFTQVFKIIKYKVSATPMVGVWPDSRLTKTKYKSLTKTYISDSIQVD